MRNWPVESYRELSSRLIARGDFSVVLVGAGPATKEPPTGFEGCVDLIGRTSLEEVVGVLQRSNILVSHDSGMVHLAALTVTRILAFYGPETARLYGPLSENKTILCSEFACSPCLSAFNHRVSVCKDNLCMRAITVDQVFDEVVKTLSRS